MNRATVFKFVMKALLIIFGLLLLIFFGLGCLIMQGSCSPAAEPEMWGLISLYVLCFLYVFVFNRINKL